MNKEQILDLIKNELNSNPEVKEWSYSIGPDDMFNLHPEILIFPLKLYRKKKEVEDLKNNTNNIKTQHEKGVEETTK